MTKLGGDAALLCQLPPYLAPLDRYDSKSMVVQKTGTSINAKTNAIELLDQFSYTYIAVNAVFPP
jgi:hypothetical protein